jgi:sialate O-acetylesterase
MMFAACGLLWCAASAPAEVKLPKIFSDNMVLQQKTKAPIWGWAEPGEAVTITLGEQTAETKAGDDGAWMAKLDTPAGGKEPLELKVKGTNEIVFKNVLIGEVWVCSGQSNMQWGVQSSVNAPEEIQNASHPQIRLFTVPSHAQMPNPEPQKDFPLELKWSECSPQNIPGFSAVA